MEPKEHKNGGTKAALFVYGVTLLENMAYLSNIFSMITYFNGYMNFGLVKSATTLTNFVGAVNLLSLVGGFVCDTYLSRYKATFLFGVIEILGYGILALQAHFNNLRPFPCKNIVPDRTSQCEPASQQQQAMFFAGLYLFALGTGAIKAAISSLGGDQFDENDPYEALQLSSYFNWLMFSITLGACIGVTVMVWISDNIGWDKSFGLCILLVVIGLCILGSGCKKYRHNTPKGSPIVRLLQVFVVAVRNRSLPAPEDGQKLHEIYGTTGQESELLHRTDQFRFLDKAAIVTEVAPWKTCTITQIEEAKIMLRMLPLILSTIFMNTCLAQMQTFSVQQTLTLNRRLGCFNIPGPSIQFIPLFIMVISLPLYDKIFVPFARKMTGIPSGIRPLQRVGVGLVLSIITMTIAGFIETKRKNLAYRVDMVDTTDPLPMTMFWLAPQFGIFGLADMFTMVGLLEFFYSESSTRMKSLGMSIAFSSLAFGYLLSSVVVEVVDNVTGGWLASNNLNRDKLNYFYWLLAGLSLVNFGFYLMCSSWYKYKKLGGAKQVQMLGKGSEDGT
ncbi:protein NRT1/ PTR FAMILY 4.4-like [Silene latifolia]|uniref:protein NRT1/ PTR FAMILY 4.4-like n=1 Tax=Silene latifolia TaxID=37657 RepID=UPI003D789360